MDLKACLSYKPGSNKGQLFSEVEVNKGQTSWKIIHININISKNMVHIHLKLAACVKHSLGDVKT